MKTSKTTRCKIAYCKIITTHQHNLLMAVCNKPHDGHRYDAEF